MLQLHYQNTDLVTIVIPAYNVEAFIKENIESILRQTYRNLEIIYVCDGCTDSTANILMQYTQDNRIRVYIETENHGAAVSRNIGMDVANGDWIIFLDADDLIEPNMIEEMVKCAIGANADMCGCYYECFDDVPDNEAHVANEMRKLYCCTYPIIETEKELRHIMQLVDKGPCTKLVHKSVYMRKEVYFQDIPNANDVYYSMVATMNTHRIVYVDKVLLHYRSSKGRKTLSTERNLKKNYVLEAYDKVYDYIAEQKNNQFLLKSFYNDVCSSVLFYLEQPVCNNIIDCLRDIYIHKWEMHEQNIEKELNYISRIIFREVLINYKKISKQDIVMLAKIEFIRSVSEKECSIWGTGLLGGELLEKISKTDIEIKHVFDSSQDKWGKRLHGYLIENFTDSKADNIIVTTPKYYNEIRKQIGNKADSIYNLKEKIWEIPL